MVWGVKDYGNLKVQMSSKAASRMQSEAPTPSTRDEQDPTVAPGIR